MRSPSIKLVLLSLVAAAGALLAPGSASAQDAAPATDTATVTIVHGLRGKLVDVYLDGQLTLEGFRPERTTDPLQVPAGDHRVELREGGSAPTDAPFATAVVPVEAGANLSVVAHLAADGEPTVSTFVNDLTTLAPGEARLVARNTAFVPPVAVLVDDAPVVDDLRSSDEYGVELASKTYGVEVRDAPDAGVLVPRNDVVVPEGSATIMYLIGAERDDSLLWIAQSIDGLQQVPSAVPTGNSGLASPSADPGSGTDPALPATLAAAAAAAMGTATWLRRRRAVDLRG